MDGTNFRVRLFFSVPEYKGTYHHDRGAVINMFIPRASGGEASSCQGR